jgi:tRNA(His) 5'-end guanylyltransferase
MEVAMAVKTLEARMKTYEAVPKTFLVRRVPVVIRIDGKAFHTFTKGFNKPFDDVIIQSMQNTMLKLCENIQGCVFGYTQSDEITLVLTDYDSITTDAWFGYNVQKMASVSASMATSYFNKELISGLLDKISVESKDKQSFTDEAQRLIKLLNSKELNAMFDSRVFNLPKDEVANCLVWRQQDAIRNSIEAVAQNIIGKKAVMNMSLVDMKEALKTKHDTNWDKYPVHLQRGSCAYIVFETVENINKKPGEKVTKTRGKWVVDKEIPIFSEDREFIEKWT